MLERCLVFDVCASLFLPFSVSLFRVCCDDTVNDRSVCIHVTRV